eukprot:SAG31_NODE_2335_length_5925_cov_3.925506_3_plen_99_part_00
MTRHTGLLISGRPGGAAAARGPRRAMRHIPADKAADHLAREPRGGALAVRRARALCVPRGAGGARELRLSRSISWHQDRRRGVTALRALNRFKMGLQL